MSKWNVFTKTTSNAETEWDAEKAWDEAEPYALGNYVPTLEQRVVECKHWRWMPGMLYQYREECDEITFPTRHYWTDPRRVMDNDFDVPACFGGISRPDLTDPATLGCLLALVREAWGDHYAFVGWFDPHWKVIRCRTESLIGCLAGRGDTEAEALVAALEAAP